MLVASTGFLAANSALRTPQDLKGVPALAIRRDPVEWALSNRDGAKATAHPKVEFAANRQTILVDAAIAGLGIANLPTCMVEDALAAGTLVRALPGWEPSPVEMTALWQKDRMTSRLVKVIVAEFAQACNSGAPQGFVGGEDG